MNPAQNFDNVIFVDKRIFVDIRIFILECDGKFVDQKADKGKQNGFQSSDDVDDVFAHFLSIRTEFFLSVDLFHRNVEKTFEKQIVELDRRFAFALFNDQNGSGQNGHDNFERAPKFEGKFDNVQPHFQLFFFGLFDFGFLGLLRSSRRVHGFRYGFDGFHFAFGFFAQQFSFGLAVGVVHGRQKMASESIFDFSFERF